MPEFDPTHPLHQGGGQPDLFLRHIDEHFARAGKSVEDISDPVARLWVLWTLIGQMDAMARTNGGGPGGEPTVEDAKRHQVMAVWTHECRRVLPTHRLEDTDRASMQRIMDYLAEDKPMHALQDVLDVRDWMPEFMHPDVRFDLLRTIWENSTDLHQNDSFRGIIASSMIAETMPGGEGHCDNAERLRRYHSLVPVDEKFERVVEDFLADCRLGMTSERSGYYDEKPISIIALCGLVAERKYSDVAHMMLASGELSFDDEFVLIAALDD